MLEEKYKGITKQSLFNDNLKFIGKIEEKILDKTFYNENKKKIRYFYKKESLQERYRIKRILYKSSLSGKKKDEIWSYLNRDTEDEL